MLDTNLRGRFDREIAQRQEAERALAEFQERVRRRRADRRRGRVGRWTAPPT